MTAIRIVVLILTASLAAAFTETPPPPSCGSSLCRLLASGNLSSLRRPDFSDYRTRVQKFYEPASYTLAWIRGGRVTDQAKAVIQVLKAAEAKGLNFDDYDGSRWDDRLSRLQYTDKSPSESDFADFDLALTICVTRYISDLHFGKANPGLFHSYLNAESAELDLPSFLRERLIHATDVKQVLEGIEPPFEGYRRTQQALQL